LELEGLSAPFELWELGPSRAAGLGSDFVNEPCPVAVDAVEELGLLCAALFAVRLLAGLVGLEAPDVWTGADGLDAEAGGFDPVDGLAPASAELPTAGRFCVVCGALSAAEIGAVRGLSADPAGCGGSAALVSEREGVAARADSVGSVVFVTVPIAVVLATVDSVGPVLAVPVSVGAVVLVTVDAVGLVAPVTADRVGSVTPVTVLVVLLTVESVVPTVPVVRSVGPVVAEPVVSRPSKAATETTCPVNRLLRRGSVSTTVVLRTSGWGGLRCTPQQPVRPSAYSLSFDRSP